MKQSVCLASHRGAFVGLQTPPLQCEQHHQEQRTFCHKADTFSNFYFPNVYSPEPPSLLQSSPSVRLRLGSASCRGPQSRGFVADPEQQHSAQAKDTQLLLPGE